LPQAKWGMSALWRLAEVNLDRQKQSLLTQSGYLD
jgi:hypothetical protein